MKISSIIGDEKKTHHLAIYVTAGEFLKATGKQYTRGCTRGTIRQEVNDWFSIKFDRAGELGLYEVANPSNRTDDNRTVFQTKTTLTKFGLKSPRISATKPAQMEIRGSSIWFKLPREFYITTSNTMKMESTPSTMITPPPIKDTTLDTLHLAIAQVNSLYKKINETGSSELKFSIVDGKLKASFTHVVEI